MLAIVVLSLALDGARSGDASTPFVPDAVRREAFAAFDSLASTAAPNGTSSEAPMRAVIVASPGDCRGNLRFANVLMRRGVAPVVGAPELVIAGSSVDTVGLRPTLPPAVRRASLRLLSTSERSMLRSIGHNGTPVMLLFDRDGRLRFVTHAMNDPVARTADMRAIRHLTMRDPTH